MKHVPTLMKLVDEHIFQAPLGGKVDDSRYKLAADDFDLMMR